MSRSRIPRPRPWGAPAKYDSEASFPFENSRLKSAGARYWSLPEVLGMGANFAAIAGSRPRTVRRRDRLNFTCNLSSFGRES